MSFDPSQLEEQTVSRLIAMAAKVDDVGAFDGEKANALSGFVSYLQRKGIAFRDFANASLDPANAIDNDELLAKLEELAEANAEWQDMATNLQTANEALQAENAQLKRGGASFNPSANPSTSGQDPQVVQLQARIAQLEGRNRDLEGEAKAAQSQQTFLQQQSAQLTDQLSDVRGRLAAAQEGRQEVIRAMKSALSQLEGGADPAGFAQANAPHAFGLDKNAQAALKQYFGAKVTQANFLDEMENAFRVTEAMCKAAGLKSSIKVRNIPAYGDVKTPSRMILVRAETNNGFQEVSAIVNEQLRNSSGHSIAGAFIRNDAELYDSALDAFATLYSNRIHIVQNGQKYAMRGAETLARSPEEIFRKVLPKGLELIYGQDQTQVRPVMDMLMRTFDI